ncbi:hypothetical protein [Sphingobacterium multivorum]|uniref:hypothetical protein n=1 Tax=Sphingobacterium multivorum TaxID=28454 RepID=UPI0031BA429E
MGRLSKVLAMVVIVAAFASCGLFRKSTKHVEKSTLEVVSKRDSSLSEKTQKDSIQRTIKTDQGITITETETTTITKKPGGKLNASVDLDKLKSGEEMLLKDSAGFRISAILDSVNNRLSIKSEAPSEEKTENKKERKSEYNNKKESNEKKGSEQVQKQVAVSHEQRQKESTKIEDIQKEPKGSMLIWLGIGALVFVIGFLFLRKKGVI